MDREVHGGENQPTIDETAVDQEARNENVEDRTCLDDFDDWLDNTKGCLDDVEKRVKEFVEKLRNTAQTPENIKNVQKKITELCHKFNKCRKNMHLLGIFHLTEFMHSIKAEIKWPKQFCEWIASFLGSEKINEYLKNAAAVVSIVGAGMLLWYALPIVWDVLKFACMNGYAAYTAAENTETLLQDMLPILCRKFIETAGKVIALFDLIISITDLMLQSKQEVVEWTEPFCDYVAGMLKSDDNKIWENTKYVAKSVAYIGGGVAVICGIGAVAVAAWPMAAGATSATIAAGATSATSATIAAGATSSIGGGMAAGATMNIGGGAAAVVVAESVMLPAGAATAGAISGAATAVVAKEIGHTCATRATRAADARKAMDSLRKHGEWQRGCNKWVPK